MDAPVGDRRSCRFLRAADAPSRRGLVFADSGPRDVRRAARSASARAGRLAVMNRTQTERPRSLAIAARAGVARPDVAVGSGSRDPHSVPRGSGDRLPLERGSHPRFAIGEPSPLANLLPERCASATPAHRPLAVKAGSARSVGCGGARVHVLRPQVGEFRRARTARIGPLVAASPRPGRRHTGTGRTSIALAPRGRGGSNTSTRPGSKRSASMTASPQHVREGHRRKRAPRGGASGPGGLPSALARRGRLRRAGDRGLYALSDVVIRSVGIFRSRQAPYPCDDARAPHLRGRLIWFCFNNGVTSAGVAAPRSHGSSGSPGGRSSGFWTADRSRTVRALTTAPSLRAPTSASVPKPGRGRAGLDDAAVGGRIRGSDPLDRVSPDAPGHRAARRLGRDVLGNSGAHGAARDRRATDVPGRGRGGAAGGRPLCELRRLDEALLRLALPAAWPAAALVASSHTTWPGAPRSAGRRATGIEGGPRRIAEAISPRRHGLSDPTAATGIRSTPGSPRRRLGWTPRAEIEEPPDACSGPPTRTDRSAAR